MNEYRFARELGNPLSRDLELYRCTRLLHTLTPSSSQTWSRSAHAAGVNALDIDTKESRFVISGGADGKLCLWDLFADSQDQRRPVSRSRVHKFGVSSVAFYPSDPGLFVSTSYDKTLKVWDAGEMSVAASFDMALSVYGAAMAPNAFHSLVAVASQSPAIRLVDLNTGGATHSLFGHTGAGVLAVGWSPTDEFILASGGTDGTVRVWDIRMTTSCLISLDMQNTKNSCIDRRNQAHEGAVNGLTWDENGASLLTMGTDDKLKVWDLVDGSNTLTNFEPVIRNRRQHHVINPIVTPLFQSDPQLVFVVSGPEVIGLHKTEGNVQVKFQASKEKINALAYQPYPPSLIFGSMDGQIGIISSSILEVPSESESEEAGEEEGENAKGPDVLDSIYRSLIQAPVTFT